jgi:hypothetical protein
MAVLIAPPAAAWLLLNVPPLTVKVALAVPDRTSKLSMPPPEPVAVLERFRGWCSEPPGLSRRNKSAGSLFKRYTNLESALAMLLVKLVAVIVTST